MTENISFGKEDTETAQSQLYMGKLHALFLGCRWVSYMHYIWVVDG